MNPIDIAVTRTIPAPAGKTYNVWIDPKTLGASWLGGSRVVEYTWMSEVHKEKNLSSRSLCNHSARKPR